MRATMGSKARVPRWLRVLAKPSAFKVGLAVLAFLCILPLFRARELHRLVESIDSRIHDLMFRIRRRRAVPLTGQVVIVDVNEDSLRELGQWPWPRTVMADVVRAIGKQGPRVIGFDIVFAEPDRTSPKNAVARLAALSGQTIELPEEAADNDVHLAEALGETNSILGYYFQLATTAAEARVEPTPEADLPCPEFSIAVAEIEELLRQSAIPVAERAVLNLPVVADSALSEGFFNTVPDGDGVTRRGSLFIRFGRVVYPSLALEMVREGLGESPLLQGLPGVGITTVALGERLLPVTRQGQLVINFRGPPGTFPYVSAADVAGGRVPEGTFRGKYVLIGTSATGLLDLRATPVANAFPGVEVNATILDNILAGDPLVYDKTLDLSVGLALLVVFGVLLAAILAFLGPRAGALFGILVLLAIVYGNYRLFFLNRRLVGLTYPYAGLTSIFLAVSVANYFFEGKRKKFIQGAFSYYVSENVVETLLRNPEMLRLEGEEKELSVLFSDIRGFTSISETMTPRQLSAFLNEYLSAMTDVIMAGGGTVDKFIGDAIMAFWGAPLDAPGHAALGVRAALGMRRRLDALRPEWEARGLPPIEIGIGINSGLMRVGNMGSMSRFDYTVMGDNVNLASRLEGLTKVYRNGTLVSEATRAAAGAAFFCRPIDLVRVKGRTEPVALFEPLLEGEPAPELRREVDGLQRAMDGYRAREFAEAQALFTSLRDARPDPLYELYLERLEHFREQPPPDDWDGVYTFKTKGKEDE
ncbi:MAG: adenylate/guanylate cyclase domain-containing protein [Lentisphaeria bacterium]|nr:adenylate/guanylate cyclase domain-containing protein [Lentisphaeria bacterium]